MTVIRPLADSYISAASCGAGAAAELTASRIEVKYAGLDGRYKITFAPIAFENLGVPSASTCQLLSYLGRRLTDISGESRETSYLFQRCSVLVYSALTLFFCMTVCQIVTARITRNTHFCRFFF